jgi:hypothetical protein
MTDATIAKKALLIGMNYQYFPGHMRLRNSVHDVEAFQSFLQKRGMQDEDIRVIVDEGDEGRARTTYAAIVRVILELAKDSWAHELTHAYFMFSGHSSQVRDMDHEEADGLDEGIAPSNFKEKGLIIDDLLGQLFSCFNPKTHVFCIFDCDTSGSMLDLPHYYIQYEDMTPYFVKAPRSMRGRRVYALSACKDKEISGVTREAMGTLTHCLLEELSIAPEQPLLTLQARLAQHSDQPRTFVLSSSHPLSMNDHFEV